MASSSNSNDSFYGPRLLWIERSPENWWPALSFENHGLALRELAPQLSEEKKRELTLKFLEDPQAPVAQIITTAEYEFVDLSPTTETRDFYENVPIFYTLARKAELEPAMKIVKQLLAQDMNGQDTTKAQEQDTTSLQIAPDESWSTVWERMRQVGWKKKHTKSGNLCWVFPGASRSSGVHGQDYFNTLQELQEYVRIENGWKGSGSVVAAEVQDESSKKKRSRDKKDQARIWGRPKKQATTVPSTPTNQKTKPQDPAKPLLDDDSSSSGSDEDQYTWKVLWENLKAEGWTVISASKYNKLDDWYYVCPRRTVEHGEMGVDYFRDPQDVIMYVRAQDEQQQDDSGSDSTTIMPSPRKRSRKVRVKEEKTTTTTVVTKKKKKSWWFHTDALPSFRQIWSILQQKLEFRYSSGCYKLPFGDQVFATDLEMRHFLLQHGIPNLGRADEEDRTILLRWVTFSHVPVKDTNSTIKLDGMQELSKEEASNMLVTQLGFVKELSGSFRRGVSETFASLEEARVYFRGAESLAPPVQGRRRSNKNEVNMSEDQVLEFRLWAALSRAELPTFPSRPELTNQDLSTPTAAASAVSEAAAAANEENQSTAVDNVEEDTSAKPEEETNRESSKKKNSIVFGSDDKDDDVPPSFSGLSSGRNNRVSLSPSTMYQPLTQCEEEY